MESRYQQTYNFLKSTTKGRVVLGLLAIASGVVIFQGGKRVGEFLFYAMQ